MNRLDLSARIFDLALFVRMIPGRAEDTCNAIGATIERFGSRVRGCPCNQDEPEGCGGSEDEWCLCNCHDREITTRTVSAEVN